MKLLASLLLTLATSARADDAKPAVPAKAAVKKTAETCHAACSKAPADPSVTRDCAELASKDECAAYVSDRFPYRCDWGKPDVPCNAP